MATAKLSEAQLQRHIVAWVNAVAPQVVIVAVPNGSQRTASGRPANAVAGLTPGVPDLIVIRPRGEVLWLEVKTEVGRVSDNQFAFHSKLVARNHMVAIVRSVDDVRRAFKAAGIETREAEQ